MKYVRQCLRSRDSLREKQESPTDWTKMSGNKVISGQPYIYTGVYGLATEPVDICDKELAVKLYVTQALCRTQSMFRYINLPDTIPQRSLELYIQTGGSCCIAEHNGELYAFFGTFGGEPDEYYMPREYIVANPALNFSKQFKIHEECVVIPNDSMYMGLMPIFRRYATMMAENDVTMYVADINMRIASLLTGDTDRDIASAEAYIEKIKAGKIGIAITTPFMDGIKAQPYGDTNANHVSKLIELQQYFKASMFNDIGLNSNYNMKRETIVSAEIELNADALFPFVDDMLRCREVALEEVNKLFGTDIRVELNSSWEDLADSREVQDVLEEAEALAAIGGETSNRLDSPADNIDGISDTNEFEDSEEEVMPDAPDVNEESADAEVNENESVQEDEQPVQEEQTQEDDAVSEIKDKLLEKIADVVDDGTEEEPLEETVEEILEEESNQLDSEEESNQLDNEVDEEKEDDDDGEEKAE